MASLRGEKASWEATSSRKRCCDSTKEVAGRLRKTDRVRAIISQWQVVNSLAWVAGRLWYVVSSRAICKKL